MSSSSAFHKIVFLVVGLLLSFGRIQAQNSVGAAKAPPPPAVSTNVPANSTPDLLIGGGDLLQVTVFGAPDFDKEVRVSAAGEVSLPMLGSVYVAGLSISQAEKLIEKQLAEGQFFTNPQVTVFAKEYPTEGVSVLGEVQKPGIYPLLGARTLFEAISAAGGTTPKAGKTATITHRDRPAQSQIVTLSYNAKDSPRSNIPVLPGDTVVISKAGIVYVVGDVRQPSGIVMESPEITVLQAMSMAQGANPTAKLSGAKVLRKTAQGQQEIPVPLEKIIAAQVPDPKLQPEDVLFVPTSTAKTAARRSFEAIVQMATGVVIYRRY